MPLPTSAFPRGRTANLNSLSPFEEAKAKIQRQYRELIAAGRYEPDSDSGRSNAVDLNIEGIKGLPSQNFYLRCLYHFRKKPPTVTAILSSRDRAKYEKEIGAYIRSEIEKYTARLKKLEQSPARVSVHLAALDGNLNRWKIAARDDWRNEPNDALRENRRFMKKRAQIFVKQTKQEIKKYSRLLRTLKKKKK